MYNVFAGGDGMLDLTNWNSQITSKMPLDLEVVLDSDYYQETEIQGLSPIHVNGVIYWNDNDELTADLQITGTMKLLDAIDMQEVDYPFAVTLSEEKIENFKKDQNTLDLNELLWENIVLEIPLKYTKVEDFSNYDKDTNTLTFTDMNDETATVNGNIYAEILPSLQGIKLKKYQTYLKDLSFVSLPTFKELIKVDEFTLNQNDSTCEFTINDSFIENIYCETDTQVVNISFVNIE